MPFSGFLKNEPANLRDFATERRFALRFITGFILCCWLYRAWSYQWLSQLAQPALISPQADNTFWLLHWLGLLDFFLQTPWAAMLLDFSILIALVVGLWRPEWRGWAAAWWLAFTVYLLSYQTAITHHGHQSLAIWWMGFALVARSDRAFVLTWWGLRYYACFAMASAGLWKVARGAAWNADQLQHILQFQHVDFIATQPDHAYNSFIFFLLEHPNLCSLLWFAAVALQLSFLVGFFTRRFDRFYILVLGFFFISDYLLMNLNFFEFCIFACLFVPWKNAQAIYTSSSTTSTT